MSRSKATRLNTNKAKKHPVHKVPDVFLSDKQCFANKQKEAGSFCS
ncbi:hypothetical protein CHCC14821_2646 [Bacillus paralicheniformis]|nr:hypothetical protein CHCC14821_2646 [Bacillus paralicheniformis]